MKKTLIAFIFILFLATPSFAGDWTRGDTYRELAFIGLLAVDYGQTMNIARHPERFSEYNPILREHPSTSTVSVYMLSVAIIHPIISYLLPPKSDKWKWINRENFQYISIGVEVGWIANNIGAGIGITF